MGTYQPREGDLVRVRRYHNTTIAPGGTVTVDRTGKVAKTAMLDIPPHHGARVPVFWLEGDEDHIATGYVFLGGSPSMYLVTVVEPVTAPVQHQIRLRVIGDRAEVTVIGDQPLPPGRYLGAVVKLAERDVA